jgi:hypothetical protein
VDAEADDFSWRGDRQSCRAACGEAVDRTPVVDLKTVLDRRLER